MIEEFAEGDEVSWPEKGAEAATDCMDVDPSVILVIEPFFLL